MISPKHINILARTTIIFAISIFGIASVIGSTYSYKFFEYLPNSKSLKNNFLSNLTALKNNPVAPPTPADTLPKKDTLKYEIIDREGDFVTSPNQNPFDLNDPAIIEKNIEYDPNSNTYIITETMGGQPYKNPTFLTFDEFWKNQNKNLQNDYWQQKFETNSLSGGSKNKGPKLYTGEDILNKLNPFGEGGLIDIRPTGNIDVELGMRGQRIDNPAFTIGQQRQGPNFYFDQNIDVGVTGKIGDRLKLNANYNTRAFFDYAQQIKLEYVGNEDEILQEIRAGNVSFPLPTTLIKGAQSLFGIQTKLKFGRLTVNTILSQQKSRAKNLTFQNGSQVQNFSVTADQYEDNKHFFLAQHFKDNYEKWVAQLPYVSSPYIITRLDVFVNDQRGNPDQVQRNMVALTDLGEYLPYNTNVTGSSSPEPRNSANNLNALMDISENNPARRLSQTTSVLETQYQLQSFRDFGSSMARKLNENEYIFDSQLGFVSLNFRLQDNQILGVSYEYIDARDGKKYQVGEFPEDVFTVDTTTADPKVLFAKMLKPQVNLPKHPVWDLMMKNVYSLGAYQLDEESLKLDVYYENATNKATGSAIGGTIGGDLRYIPEGVGIRGVPLIQVLNLDRLNIANQPNADGLFDFLPAKLFSANIENNINMDNANNNQQGGIGGNIGGGNIGSGGANSNNLNNDYKFGTINTRNGRLIFPVLEPFGKHLHSKFIENGNSEELAAKYVFDSLYRSTKTVASIYPERNRFFIKGSYKSKVTGQISLGAFNIPPGSVKVTAGGKVLQEGVDYEVDESLGRITILNQAYIEAGIPIDVAFEDNAAFGLQQRTLMGARLDYYINKDFGIGGTIMRLSERPFTRKINYGDDPIANAIAGVDAKYFKQTPWVTKALDKLPFYTTKEPSSLSLYAEGAAFMPGHARAIGSGGTAYIDDFEGSKNEYDLKFPHTEWMLASTPKDAPNAQGNIMFPEASAYLFGSTDSLAINNNRALLSWYRLDFLSTQNIQKDDNHYARLIPEREVFPNRQSQLVRNSNLFTFDLALFPNQRGQYNYETKGSPFSAGLNYNGTLKKPESRWGGVMRESPYKDFEAANVEFIEFWLMDPFIYPNQQNNSGDLYIQLGNVSEDVLKDGRAFYENALPAPGQVTNLDTTSWGVVPKIPPIVNGFDNTPEARRAQDVGYDGMSDSTETKFFNAYLNEINSIIDPQFIEPFKKDPSNDDYTYFNDATYSSLQANNFLTRYKKMNGAEGNSPVIQGFVNSAGTAYPEMEDINQDRNLITSEGYFQYRIPLKPKDQMEVGKDFLQTYRDVTIAGNSVPEIRWYYFRVPIKEFTEQVGSVNARNIESMRVFLTGFKDSVICRFGTFDLVRSNWRRYDGALREEGEYLPNDNASETFFNVSAVGVEETPGYIIPPQIIREQAINGNDYNSLQNEQALSVQVGNLADGEARAVFKTLDMDMRVYKKIKMFVHSQKLLNRINCEDLEDGDMRAFVRIGDDFLNNYYEYEIPLKLSPNAIDQILTPEQVWPTENIMEINIRELVNNKVARNFDDNNPAFNKPYIKYVTRQNVVDFYAGVDSPFDTARITVVGAPDFGKAKRMMLGVRNAKRNFLNKDTDDGDPKCAEVWFNELRLTDFEDNTGYAALARMDVKLADLGTLNVSGYMHTAGFGSLEQRINERFQDNVVRYDASTNLELGKFLPQNSGIRIPTYVGVREKISTPKYDPYDTDVYLRQNLDSIRAVQNLDSKKVKEYKQQRQTAEHTKSLNFTNVRKDRTSTAKKPQLYDIENWNATYAFTEINRRDPVVENEKAKRHFGALAYMYTTSPVFIKPFASKNIIPLVKDLNFNFVPNRVAFGNELERRITRLQLRKLGGEDLYLPAFYNKLFTWDRKYELEYQPAQSIKINYDARSRSIIDEPAGAITDSVKKVIWDNAKKLGRPTEFNQNVSIGYNLPINKIPFLDWITTRTSYSANYLWQANPPNIADTLGNTINNAQTMQLNSEFAFDKLYNKVPLFKKVLAPNNVKKKPTPKPKNKKDKNLPEEPETLPQQPKVKNNNDVNPVLRAILQPILSLKRVSLSYTGRRSTLLPGFMYKPQYFGQNFDQKAPGLDFILGYQPDSTWLNEIGQKGFITKSQSQNNQVFQTQNQSIRATAKFEPFRDLTIDLNTTLNYNKIHREFFKPNDNGEFKHLRPVEEGSFSVSYITIRTMYDGLNNRDISVTFKQFEENRKTISKRLQELNPNSTGVFQNDTITLTNYAQGYGPYNADVLLPAFIAAYAGTSPDAYKNLNPLTTTPLPNWKITYNGLGKLPVFRGIFKTINLTHSYSSTLNLNSFNTELDFVGKRRDVETDNQLIDRIIHEDLGLPVVIDTNTGNFFAQYRIPNVSITEQLAPLIGINATLQTGTTIRFDWKKSRTLGMSFEDYQLSEQKSEEFNIGLGHRFNDGLNIPFANINLKNQLELMFEFSVKQNLTTNYRLDQDIAQPTSGNTVIRIAPSIEYMVNDKLRVSLFYERTQTIPAITTSFPVTNYKGGLKINYALTQ